MPATTTSLEVDFVVTIGAHRIPLEVKYRHDAARPKYFEGLHHFIEKKAYGAPFGLLVCQEPGPERDQIIQIPAWTFLLLR